MQTLKSYVCEHVYIHKGTKPIDNAVFSLRYVTSWDLNLDFSVRLGPKRSDIIKVDHDNNTI